MMHIVRELKKYNAIRIANAMYAVGYRWKRPRNIPTNIDRMVQGLPRCDLERILREVRK